MLPEPLRNGLDLLHRGGWVMVPLLFLSVVSLALIIERLLAIREAGHGCGPLLDAVRPLLQQRRYDEAARLCAREEGPVARVLQAGIERHALPLEDIERGMEEVALRETPTLRQNLGALDTIITMAPLLGLLGTITGMIQSFHVVSSSASSSAATAITGGVAEALIATATGLTVAIVTLPFYNGLSERVKEISSDMEWRATQLLNILAAHKFEERAARESDPVRAVLWRDKAVLQANHSKS